MTLTDIEPENNPVDSQDCYFVERSSSACLALGVGVLGGKDQTAYHHPSAQRGPLRSRSAQTGGCWACRTISFRGVHSS